MSLADGKFSEMKILERTTLDEYFAIVSSYLSYVEEKNRAHEAAMQKARK